VRQLEPVRLDDKKDRPAVGGPHLRQADDRDQRPAARTSGTERSRTSPPMTSNTTSTSPASSSRPACRSTNTSAPSPSAASRSAARPVPITRAPSSCASCTAIDPTPPAAPWIRTVWPVLSPAWSKRPCQAVSQEIGTAAATV
jgi:hypothetical protein